MNSGTGETGGNILLPIKEELSHPRTSAHLVSCAFSLPLSLLHFFSLVFNMQTHTRTHTHTHTRTHTPQAISKRFAVKTKTPTHPHRSVQRLRLDVYHAEVTVQHLFPSELLQFFVDSRGLEVCIWVVFMISRWHKRQRQPSDSMTHSDASHAKWRSD